MSWLRAQSPWALVYYLEQFFGRGERTPSGCLIWRGEPGAYGTYSFRPKGDAPGAVCAHRAAWLMLVGRIDWRKCPVVRHLCHTPGCINIHHLEPGTESENQGDRRHAPAMAPRLRPRPGICRVLRRRLDEPDLRDRLNRLLSLLPEGR